MMIRDNLSVLFICLWILAPNCDASIRCFECNDMFKPFFCDTVTLCADNEECYLDQFITSGGKTLYNSGCRSQQRCGVLRRSIDEKLDDVNNDVIVEDSSTDIIACQTCCNDTNYCNNKGCGETPLDRRNRGPYCFECSNQSEDSCRHVTHCDVNWACEIYSKTLDGYKIYDSRCVHIAPNTVCNTTYAVRYNEGATVVGKRDLTPGHCSKCCDLDFCNDDCSHHLQAGSFTDWEGWSPCPKSCGGGGIQSRTRKCPLPPCAGALQEYRSCDQQDPCPVTESLTDWESWSSCSLSCGGAGIQSRTRNCSLPPCTDALQENRSCDQQAPCPVDGGWGVWLEWGDCTKTCGIGSQTRSRTCDSPLPQNGGKNCTGLDIDQKDCAGLYCPPIVNGGWTSWNQWTPCSVTCGFGSKTRTRDCANPVPQHGGNDCQGYKKQTSHCQIFCAASECSKTPGYTLMHVPLGNHHTTRQICINIYNQEVTWYTASDLCHQDGAHLTSFSSPDANLDHVFPHTSDLHAFYWIGLIYQNGNWQWADGGHQLSPSAQHMLGHNYVNNIHSISQRFSNHRACIIENGESWKPVDCKDKHYFVCEIPVQ